MIANCRLRNGIDRQLTIGKLAIINRQCQGFTRNREMVLTFMPLGSEF
jgi:hypothetical protein